MNPDDLLNGPTREWAAQRIGDFARDLATRGGVRLAELMLEEIEERRKHGLHVPSDSFGRARSIMEETFKADTPFGPSVVTEMVEIGMESFRARFAFSSTEGSA